MEGGGHSPKMPENPWMGGLKNMKNCKYGCEAFEIEKKIAFLYILKNNIVLYIEKDFKMKTSTIFYKG